MNTPTPRKTVLAVIFLRYSRSDISSYGDSITQGYDALFPSYSYINRFSMYLDAFIYNKAIGGDIFRPALIERKILNLILLLLHTEQMIGANVLRLIL